MGRGVPIAQFAEKIMKELIAYEKVTEEAMKVSVRRAANTTKKNIKTGAPKRSKAYEKSWGVKKLEENPHALTLTVYSRNRYQLAHLLEKGHAKRGGGRTKAISHIAPAEKLGEEQLMRDIERIARYG